LVGLSAINDGGSVGFFFGRLAETVGFSSPTLFGRDDGAVDGLLEATWFLLISRAIGVELGPWKLASLSTAKRVKMAMTRTGNIQHKNTDNVTDGSYRMASSSDTIFWVISISFEDDFFTGGDDGLSAMVLVFYVTIFSATETIAIGRPLMIVER
jgi:hypothetical protein